MLLAALVEQELNPVNLSTDLRKKRGPRLGNLGIRTGSNFENPVEGPIPVGGEQIPTNVQFGSHKKTATQLNSPCGVYVRFEVAVCLVLKMG